MRPTVLFSEEVIAERVKAIAKEIAQGPAVPHLATPILVGAYVFAADLLRALANEGISIPTEFLWLRSYVGRQAEKNVKVLIPPNENFQGKNVLLIDGVLDGGHTIAKARELVKEYGAANVISAVVVDKELPTAVEKADFACFKGCQEFIVGYGMDEAGNHRALPYIAKMDEE
ncbi:hypoxanthine phosphoribosyltransferase [Rhizomicrobium palustre]|uniref:Hypoxanthine phosphoribosyltransferase n=1 Tax=Rhizomicrobium palustre TaxID=189966 RepID=A0A846MXH3_9PROT|nr:phosphoribosyltransferase family protein [Rhizomicrobium palustre]NIK87925.1 hypoxanthine phosphoribosyltransferase [Rhizomicrobium palustre]